jgi:hypothetical protein
VYCYLAISAQRRLTLIIKSVSKELFIVEERIELALVGFQNLARTGGAPMPLVQIRHILTPHPHVLPPPPIVSSRFHFAIQQRCSTPEGALCFPVGPWPHHHHLHFRLPPRKPVTVQLNSCMRATNSPPEGTHNSLCAFALADDLIVLQTPKHHTHHHFHTRRRPHRVGQPSHPCILLGGFQEIGESVHTHAGDSPHLHGAHSQCNACTRAYLDASNLPKILLHKPCSTEVEGQRVSNHEVDHAPQLFSIIPASLAISNVPLVPTSLEAPQASQLTYQLQHA